MKKGYTLVEIIAVIAILAIVSVASVVGIKIYNNNNTITALNEMEDQIYEAANVYLETNKKANENLYTKKNGVVIPLTVLQNEGLIDFQGIDISNKYVVAALGTKLFEDNTEDDTSEESDDCMGAEIVNSWNHDETKTIFLCGQKQYDDQINDLYNKIKSLKDTSVIINETIINYINEQTEEQQNLPTKRTYYTGRNVKNYVKYTKSGKNYTFRILYQDIDGGYALLSTDTDYGNFDHTTITNCLKDQDFMSKFDKFSMFEANEKSERAENLWFSGDNQGEFFTSGFEGRCYLDPLYGFSNPSYIKKNVDFYSTYHSTNNNAVSLQYDNQGGLMTCEDVLLSSTVNDDYKMVAPSTSKKRYMPTFSTWLGYHQGGYISDLMLACEHDICSNYDAGSFVIYYSARKIKLKKCMTIDKTSHTGAQNDPYILVNKCK